MLWGRAGSEDGGASGDVIRRLVAELVVGCAPRPGVAVAKTSVALGIGDGPGAHDADVAALLLRPFRELLLFGLKSTDGSVTVTTLRCSGGPGTAAAVPLQAVELGRIDFVGSESKFRCSYSQPGCVPLSSCAGGTESETALQLLEHFLRAAAIGGGGGGSGGPGLGHPSRKEVELMLLMADLLRPLDRIVRQRSDTVEKVPRALQQQAFLWALQLAPTYLVSSFLGPGDGPSELHTGGGTASAPAANQQQPPTAVPSAGGSAIRTEEHYYLPKKELINIMLGHPTLRVRPPGTSCHCVLGQANQPHIARCRRRMRSGTPQNGRVKDLQIPMCRVRVSGGSHQSPAD